MNKILRTKLNVLYIFQFAYCDNGKHQTDKVHVRMKVRVELLYTEDVMVASTGLGCLQTVFGTLTGIFDRVGLQKNVKKTVGMVCHLCPAAGVQSDEAYTRRITGETRSYK